MKPVEAAESFRHWEEPALKVRTHRKERCGVAMVTDEVAAYLESLRIHRQAAEDGSLDMNPAVSTCWRCLGNQARRERAESPQKVV
jgi:hypothetical protein